ncbi:MAG: XTP/dITP diphosphatase [Nitrospirae bacterium]|nr:XTP/dITP diphosphatase [Nitrospirota bacterium]
MNIVLATRNRKKVEEIRKIFASMKIEPRFYSLDDFPECTEAEEDGVTFEENAVKKAVQIFKCTKMTAIADDSGLEVDALKGAPGVYSARYAGEPSDDFANSRKLLDEIKDISDEGRGARFVCCIALAEPDGVKTFIGYVKGRIGREMRGRNGFGYDPLFFPEGHDRTFAEMDDTEKNAMSHRGEALRELREYMVRQAHHDSCHPELVEGKIPDKPE